MSDDLDAEAKSLAYQAAGLSVELEEGPEAWPDEFESHDAIVSPMQTEWEDPWGEPFTAADAFKPRPPIEYIVDGIFRRRSLNMIYGPPGCLKTLLVLDLCIAVAAGRDWLPSPPDVQVVPYTTIQMPTMFVDFDNDQDELDERVEALIRGRNLVPESLPFYYYSFPEGGFNASNDVNIGDMMNRIEKYKIGMWWTDNLGIIKGGASENSDEMIPVMHNLRKVAVTTSVMSGVVHYQNKGQGFNRRTGENIRGHSSIEGSLNLGLQIERKPFSDNITIQPAKVRGNMMFPFSATWAYEHKIGTTTLESAIFYGAIPEGDLTDVTIDATIKAALKDGLLNKTSLIKAVKERMPDIGINRIRSRIERLTTGGEIIEQQGKRTERFYSLP